MPNRDNSCQMKRDNERVVNRSINMKGPFIMTLVHSASVVPHSVKLPPCILIHGAANSESVWRYWLETLSAKGSAAFAVESAWAW